MSEHVCILGTDGFLGSYISNNLEGRLISHYDREFYDRVEVGNTRWPYTHIINCIGKPDVKFCDENVLASFNSNVSPVLKMKQLFPNAKIINFSSYYVYNDNGEQCEDSQNLCLSHFYSIHKLFSEVVNTNGITFRLGNVYDKDNQTKSNFYNHVKYSNEIHTDLNTFNPISTKQILEIIIKYLNGEIPDGLYNLGGNTISHLKFARMIKEKYKTTNDTIVYKMDYENKYLKNYGKFTMNCDKIKQYDGVTEILNRWDI